MLIWAVGGAPVWDVNGVPIEVVIELSLVCCSFTTLY
jgi:hypothetical protein